MNQENLKTGRCIVGQKFTLFCLKVAFIAFVSPVHRTVKLTHTLPISVHI